MVRKNFNFSEEAEKYLDEPLRKFSYHLYEWHKSNHVYAIFIKKNGSWLEKAFCFPKEALKEIPIETELCQPSTSTNLKQEQDESSSKRKSFLDVVDRQKRRRGIIKK